MVFHWRIVAWKHILKLYDESYYGIILQNHTEEMYYEMLSEKHSTETYSVII